MILCCFFYGAETKKLFFLHLVNYHRNRWPLPKFDNNNYINLQLIPSICAHGLQYGPREGIT